MTRITRSGFVHPGGGDFPTSCFNSAFLLADLGHSTMARNVSPYPMISIEEATCTALSLVTPLEPEVFPLESLLVRGHFLSAM